MVLADEKTKTLQFCHAFASTKKKKQTNAPHPPCTVCDPKPGNLLLISPNIKVQTESSRGAKAPHHPPGDPSGAAAGGHGTRRRNFLDAGIELLFKKREPRTGVGEQPAKANAITDHLMHRGHHLHHFHQRDHHTILDTSPVADRPPALHRQPSPGEERTGRGWRPFESIKIHTDKRQAGAGSSASSSGADHEPDKHRRKDGKHAHTSSKREKLLAAALILFVLPFKKV